MAFKKGVPTYAPDQMHAELIRHGIVPTEEIPEPEDDGGVKEPTVPADRQAAVFAAFEKVILRGKRGDFAGSLSGGQRKLLEMARSLMAQPSLVMLDEPMAGVNPALTSRR